MMRRVCESVCKSVGVLSALLFLSACATSPQAVESATSGPGVTLTGGYSSGPGTLPVGVIPVATLHDGSRNRDVGMMIEYPTRNGPYPIIVFSHALGASNSSYEALSAYWTSHGYVTIRPKHADAGMLKDAKDGPALWQKQNESDWANRARDLTFVIDSLDALEQKYPELRDRMDHTRVAAAGHGYGALTTMLVAGTKTSGPITPNLADARIKGAIAMSPAGAGEVRGLTADSWKDVRIPLLYLAGTADEGKDGEAPARGHDAFQYSPAGDKYYVSIEGARTASFMGRFDITEEERRDRTTGSTPPIYRDPRDPRDPINDPSYQQQSRTPRGNGSAYGRERQIFNTIKSATLAFWDAYLKTDNAGREFLKSPSLRAAVGTAGAVETK